jgi:hypothetical protein
VTQAGTDSSCDPLFPLGWKRQLRFRLLFLSCDSSRVSCGDDRYASSYISYSAFQLCVGFCSDDDGEAELSLAFPAFPGFFGDLRVIINRYSRVKAGLSTGRF